MFSQVLRVCFLSRGHFRPFLTTVRVKNMSFNKNSQEWISPNMSSQFQLVNSLELIFQLGDVNWTIFGEFPLGFVLGCPSFSARCLAGRLSGQENCRQVVYHQGKTFYRPNKNVCVPKIRDISRKCRTLRLPEERARVPKSEIYFPRKRSTVRLLEERPRNRDFFLGNVVFERVWGGLYGPMVCQLDNSIFGNLLAVRSQLKCSFEFVF